MSASVPSSAAATSGVVSPSLDAGVRRSDARELKFLVPEAKVPALLAWIRAHLAPDPNAAGPHGDEYLTRTVYWDTPDFAIARRARGVGRSKYRVRTYGDDLAAVFVERKLRTEKSLFKRRTALAVEDLAACGDPRAPGPAGWFRRRVASRGLRPVALIGYRRVARQGVFSGAPVRLTLDTGLRAAPAAAVAFDFGPDVVAPAAGHAVLELKYVGEVPAVFKRMLGEFSLFPEKFSKYRAASRLLGRIADADDLGED